MSIKDFETILKNKLLAELKQFIDTDKSKVILKLVDSHSSMAYTSNFDLRSIMPQELKDISKPSASGRQVTDFDGLDEYIKQHDLEYIISVVGLQYADAEEEPHKVYAVVNLFLTEELWA